MSLKTLLVALVAVSSLAFAGHGQSRLSQPDHHF